MAVTASEDCKAPWWHHLYSPPWRAFILIFSVLLLFQRPFFVSFIVSYFIYIFLGGWRYQRLLFLTLPRDLRGLRCLICMMRDTKRVVRSKETFGELFARVVQKRGPGAVAIYYEDQQWTFGQLDAYSNKVANLLLGQGFKQGDRLYLLVKSSPAYIATWLGAAKIGVATALVNYNLRKSSLDHSLSAIEARGIVVGMELRDAFAECEMSKKFDPDFVWFLDEKSTRPASAFSESTDSRGTWNQLMTKFPCKAPPPLSHTTDTREHLLYVYTSGTTGMPKAAVITKLRYAYITCGIRYGFGIRISDILYTPLPLYHTAGGIVAVGQLLLYGTTLAIRSKFSASQYWTDCIRYRATVSQYIGEICRYLLAQPSRPTDQQHQVRLAFGNGLSKQIWEPFKHRFNIKKIGEFFGATESNTSIPNVDGKVGAVGFIPRLAHGLYPMELIRTNPDTQEVIRDPKTGLCIPCAPFEKGQIIGRINNKNPIRSFDGYVKKEESNRKILQDVFKKGDMWFLSGDLMYEDDLGYLYFADRLGDTFRWRGENVATSEVEAVVNTVALGQSNVVYGVQVPGIEGRAGMLAMAVDWNTFTAEDEIKLIENLRTVFEQQLPSYARPVFIRLTKEIDTTGTYKLRKVELMKAGFALDKSDDHVYFCDPKTHSYKRLDEQIFEQIQQGLVRF